MRPILGLMDIVLYDVKHMDPDRHQLGTGVANDLILDNLKRVDSQGLPVRVRPPLVPGFNDSVENIHSTASFVSGLANLQALDNFALSPHGRAQWGQLGQPYAMHGVVPHTRDQVPRSAREYGIVVTVRG